MQDRRQLLGLVLAAGAPGLPHDAHAADVQRFEYQRWDAGHYAAWRHCLDDRQMRDILVWPPPGRGGSNLLRLRDYPELLDPRRTLLGAEQEGWLAGGWALEGPWNLPARQTLMAHFSREDPAPGSTCWTDGRDGYAPARRRLLAA